MEEDGFKELFQKIVNQYELSPDVATKLLHKILATLKSTENDSLQTD